MNLFPLSSVLLSIFKFHEERRLVIAGRPCSLITPIIPQNVNEQDRSSTSSSLDGFCENENADIPIIFIGGTAQTIDSWSFHLPSLVNAPHMKYRSFLLYECLGIGLGVKQQLDNLYSLDDRDSNIDVSDPYKDVTLLRQATILKEVLSIAFSSSISSDGLKDANLIREEDVELKVDIVGFSFGARVAMAMATFLCETNNTENDSNLLPKSLKRIKIRKMHLTGIGAKYNSLILSHWKVAATVSTKNMKASGHDLEAFAWTIILSTYSMSFLENLPKQKFKQWVKFICENNDANGIRAILEQTHVDEWEDEWHTVQMTKRIAAATDFDSHSFSCRFILGSEDQLCRDVQRLESILTNQESENDSNSTRSYQLQCTSKSDEIVSVEIFDGCGHAVPIEAATKWRRDVMQFLRR